MCKRDELEITRHDGSWVKLYWRTPSGKKTALIGELGSDVADDHVVTYLARLRGRVIGAFRVSLGFYNPPGAEGAPETTVYACGTLVKRRYRRMGVATKLWEAVLACEKPDRVAVTVVSDTGKTFVRSMERKHSEINWCADEGGNRFLRVLVKGRAA